MVNFWRIFENLKLLVKQSYQMQDQNLAENSNATFWVLFKHCAHNFKITKSLILMVSNTVTFYYFVENASKMARKLASTQKELNTPQHEDVFQGFFSLTGQLIMKSSQSMMTKLPSFSTIASPILHQVMASLLLSDALLSPQPNSFWLLLK